VRKELGDDGRVYVRYSGTEHICRVMVEGKQQKMVQQYATRIAEKIKKAIG